jgi:hypothetical protein
MRDTRCQFATNHARGDPIREYLRSRWTARDPAYDPLVQDLVGAAIEKAKAERKRVKPLSNAIAKKLRFTGGRKVPASLRAWLAFDTAWIELDVKKSGEIASDTIAATLEARFPGMGPWDDFQILLPAPVVLLPLGADSCHLLYLGKADAKGEYPVLVVDTDDTSYVTIYSPSFDVWIAEAWDALPEPWEREHYGSMFDHPTYAKATKRQATANLHGLKEWDIQDPLPKKLRKPVKHAKSKPEKVELPPEALKKIDAMVKRRKKQIDRVSGALEIARAAMGNLRDPVVEAVARHLGEDFYFCIGVAVSTSA